MPLSHKDKKRFRTSGANSNIMDPLSISVSIITLLQATDSVFKYVQDVIGAKEERTKIFQEVTTIRHFLLVLQNKVPDPAQPGDKWFKTLKSFKEPHGPLEQLQVSLDRLVLMLKSAKAQKRFGNLSWTWHFKKEEVKEILANVERQKNCIALALENDHMFSNSLNVLC